MRIGKLYPYYGAASAIDMINAFEFDGPHLLVAEDGTVYSNGCAPMLQLVNGQFWVSNHAHVISTENRSDLDFLYYSLRSTDISDLVTGAVQPKLSKANLLQHEIFWPKTEIRSGITRILKSLDDKIDLLHRQNKTLEALAETLFRQWFVEEAEEGWVQGRLDDILVLQRGFDLPSPQREDGPYQVMAASGPSGGHAVYKVKGPGVTTGRSGVIGNVYYVHDDFWPLNTSLWVKEYKGISPVFAYHLLKTLDLGGYNSGSAVPTLNRNHVHGIEVKIPPTELLKRFDVVATSLQDKQRMNEAQALSLTKLRDTLLPKLMSGEVRVEARSTPLEK